MANLGQRFAQSAPSVLNLRFLSGAKQHQHSTTGLSCPDIFNPVWSQPISGFEDSVFGKKNKKERKTTRSEAELEEVFFFHIPFWSLNKFLRWFDLEVATTWKRFFLPSCSHLTFLWSPLFLFHLLYFSFPPSGSWCCSGGSVAFLCDWAKQAPLVVINATRIRFS